MNKDIEQLISSYIEGDISEQNKIIIENNIKNNKEFLSNLDNKINNPTNSEGYFFNKNIKLLFGFTSILVVAVLFISNYMNNDIEVNNIYDQDSKVHVSDSINKNNNSSLASEHDKDSILNTHDNFPINQVDYNK